jgi:hypothetical protein
MEGFNWTESAFKVLDAGTDVTIKYESDGTARPYDTMEAYFWLTLAVERGQGETQRIAGNLRESLEKQLTIEQNQSVEERIRSWRPRHDRHRKQ